MKTLTIPLETETIGFVKFPKIPRLFRTPQQKKDMSPTLTITEKIDGTNGCIVISEKGDVWAQSRNRFITPDDDNYGFASWVHDNAGSLYADLGPGRHFGEWYGNGINRGYGLKVKRFALFNTQRWSNDEDQDAFRTFGLEVVPVLRFVYDFSIESINDTIDNLKRVGSYAAPGFMTPEGIVIFHHASGQFFKDPFDKYNGEWKNNERAA